MEKLTETILVHLTPEQKRTVVRAAEQRGMKAGQYIRFIIVPAAEKEAGGKPKESK